MLDLGIWKQIERGKEANQSFTKEKCCIYGLFYASCFFPHIHKILIINMLRRFKHYWARVQEIIPLKPPGIIRLYKIRRWYFKTSKQWLMLLPQQNFWYKFKFQSPSLFTYFFEDFSFYFAGRLSVYLFHYAIQFIHSHIIRYFINLTSDKN